MDTRIATYWLAAARTGYAEPRDWRSWADRVILGTPSAPLWIINVSLAEDAGQLKKALEDKLDSEWRVPTRPSMDDIQIGYIWLRHKRGDIALLDCLRLAGDQADAGDAQIPCEVIYELLNRLKQGEPRE